MTVLALLAACRPEPSVPPRPEPDSEPEPDPDPAPITGDTGAPVVPDAVVWELPACDIPDALATFGWAEAPAAERYTSGLPWDWVWDLHATGIALGEPQTVFLARTWRNAYNDVLEHDVAAARAALWRSDDTGCTWSELPVRLDRSPLRLDADRDVVYAWTDVRGEWIHDVYMPVAPSSEILVWDGTSARPHDVGAGVWMLSAVDGRVVVVDVGCAVSVSEDLGGSFVAVAGPPPTGSTLTAAYVDPIEPDLVACGFDDGRIWWRTANEDWRSTEVAEPEWQVTGIARSPVDPDRWWSLVAIPPVDPQQYGRDARYQVRTTGGGLGSVFGVVHEMGDNGSSDLHLGRGVLHPSPVDADETWVFSAGDLQTLVVGSGSVAIDRSPADQRIAEPIRLPGQPTAWVWGTVHQMIIEDYD